MKKKLLSLLLALAMVFTLAACGEKKPDPGKDATATEPVVILHTNDVHGAVSNYAKVAALASQYESEGAYVLILDAGDFSQGDTAVSVSEGATAVELMNMVGYDAVALGNHEFDYGYAQLKENMSKAKFKVVCADVFNEDGTPIFDANYTYTTKSGVKVGFFGMETPETQTKANPALMKGLSFIGGKDLYKVTQEDVDMARSEGNADIVIALGHLGVDKSSEPNCSYNVMQNVKGIDLFIDGHSHTVMTASKDNNMVQSTGTGLAYVGAIVIDNATKSIESNGLIDLSAYTKEDATVKAAADKIISDINAEYGKVFARTDVELNGDKDPGNRTQETNLGDLITDSMLWAIRKDAELTVPAENVVAITNGGGIRAWIHKGDISKLDVNTVLPFGNTVAVVYVTGAELLEALEASTFALPDSLGGFPQIAGMNISIDATKKYDPQTTPYPSGSGKATYYGPASINRVTINSVNGKAFDPNKTYAVVTNNFCAAGGDTYYAFAAASSQFDTGLPLDEVLMDYITTELKGVIGAQYAEPQGRILMNPFKDVKTSAWYGSYVIDLYNDGIINGTSATTYAPNDTLTWGAALKLLLVSSGDLKAEDATGADWLKNTMAKAVELGIAPEDADGKALITRLAFCQTAAKLNKLAESKTESPFTDCTDGYVMALVDAKVINGMTETTFEPSATLTRAQIAAFLARSMK